MGIHSGHADRNTDLFFDVADILEFYPEEYDQHTWGEFKPEDVDYANFEKRFGYDPRDGEGIDDANWIFADEGCETSKCVAGHAVAMSGWHPTIYRNSEGVDVLHWGTVAEKPQQQFTSGRDVSDVAATLLGITGEEAEHLFHSAHAWSPDELRKIGKGARILTDEGEACRVE